MDRGGVRMIGEPRHPFGQFGHRGTMKPTQIAMGLDMAEQHGIVHQPGFARCLRQAATILQGEHPTDPDGLAGRQRLRQRRTAAAHGAGQSHCGFVAISRTERLCLRGRDHGPG